MTLLNETQAYKAHPEGGLFSRLFDGRNIVFAVTALIIGWLVFVPLAALLYTAFTEDTGFGPGAATLDNFVRAYSDPFILELYWNSFVFGAGSAVLTFAMGAAVAWAVERTNAPGREVFHTLALISFALPGLLATMAWTLTLSPNIGWVNKVIQGATGTDFKFNIYSMTGMIWVLSTHYFPLAYLLLGPAFRALDVRMEEASEMAGANNRQTLARVTIPLLRPAILSTLLLLFIRAIESFEVPRIIGSPARIHVFTTDVHKAATSAPPEFGLASALSLSLLVVCIIAVYFYRRATRNAEAFATITGKGYKPVPIALGAWRWPVTIMISTMFFIALGLPLLTLIWQSFYKTLATPFAVANSLATLENYSYILSYPVFAKAVQSSVLLGVMAATIVVVLTFVAAWIVQRGRSRWGWVIDALAFSPIAVPGIIVGASVLFAYLMVPIGVYNTIWIILIAYATIYLPYGMRFATSGMTQIHKELDEAAEMAGAGTWQMFRRILMPLLAPVMVSAWLYVFVLAVRELSSSIFLIGPGTHVLGTISLSMWEEGGSYGAVCALGMVQIVPLVAIVGFLRWLEKRVSLERG